MYPPLSCGDVPPGLGSADEHTLVIGGNRDYLTGIQPVVDYATTLGAGLSMIEGCGHYPWIEQPDTFRRITDEWLSTVQTPRI